MHQFRVMEGRPLAAVRDVRDRSAITHECGKPKLFFSEGEKAHPAGVVPLLPVWEVRAEQSPSKIGICLAVAGNRFRILVGRADSKYVAHVHQDHSIRRRSDLLECA